MANRLAEYGRQTMAWNVEGLLDLTDPQLFEIVPREVLVHQFNNLQSDENITIKVTDFTVDRIGEIVSSRGVDYAPVDFHHGITFRLVSATYCEPDNFQRVVRMLEKNYGKVSVDRATNVLKVTTHKSMFAIRRKEKGPWYFVEYRPQNASMIDLLVPAVVREMSN